MVSETSGSFEKSGREFFYGGYLVNPNGDTVWSYAGVAGIAANGSDLTSDNSGAPHGNQVGFIANNGLISQIWNMETPGTYALSFMVAQRATGNDSYQRLRVSLRPSSAASTAKTFVWSGNTIVEERDSTGASASVRKRFFAEGEQRIGGKDEGLYYYSRDHLGSIREVTNENGEPVAQYDYDAWGNRVTLTGNPNFDFGYTGHYFHQPSGMSLATNRAYSPTLGRWISRDPIGEAGGVNLYSYVEADPIRSVDRSGLADVDVMTGGLGLGSWWSELYPARYGSVRELVSTVISQLPPGEQLDTLTIHAHAAPGVAYLGESDYVYRTHVPQDILAALSRLKPLFSPHGSLVLAQCNVAAPPRGRETMQTIADVLRVPVLAAEGFYYDASGFSTVPIVVTPRK